MGPKNLKIFAIHIIQKKNNRLGEKVVKIAKGMIKKQNMRTNISIYYSY